MRKIICAAVVTVATKLRPARVTAATTARATKGVKAVLWEDLQIKMSQAAMNAS